MGKWVTRRWGEWVREGVNRGNMVFIIQNFCYPSVSAKSGFGFGY